MLRLIFFFLASMVAVNAAAESLPPVADLGFQYRVHPQDIEVTQVQATAPVYAAGLREGDRINSVNGESFTHGYEVQAALWLVRGDTLLVLSHDNPPGQQWQYHPVAMAKEQAQGLQTQSHVVRTSDGSLLRSYITRPVGTKTRLPVILVTQWVSCGSIRLDNSGPFFDVLRDVAVNSGHAMVRVERSANGDSVGPRCHQLDYNTEVQHYREAFLQMLDHDWVDPTNVTLFGLSLGSTTASLLADLPHVQRIVVSGGGGLSYFERMVDFDRLGFTFGQDGHLHLADAGVMADHIRFQYRYLMAGESPDQLIQEPAMAAVWERMRGTQDGTHYGRPYRWHQQAAQHDFLAAWSKFSGQVLVVYGAYDQFESARGHQAIAQQRNAMQPGSARYHELPQTGHIFHRYATRADALAFNGGVNVADDASAVILDWLRE